MSGQDNDTTIGRIRVRLGLEGLDNGFRPSCGVTGLPSLHVSSVLWVSFRKFLFLEYAVRTPSDAFHLPTSV